MKRKAKQSGSGGRLRLGLLMACAAAFLLVPVAQAAAAEEGKMIVTLAGTGTGKVSSEGTEFEGSPAINCSNIAGEEESVCENTMTELSESESAVSLEAFAGPGSEFVGWTVTEGFGFATGSFDPCEEHPESGCSVIAVSPGGGEVTATFKEAAPKNILTIDGAGTGDGTVDWAVGSEEGACTIEAGTPSGECVVESEEGAGITTTATGASGSEFVKWTYVGGGFSNCNSEEGTKNPCSTTLFTPVEEGTLTATFEPLPPNVLEVVGTGTGSGVITSEFGNEEFGQSEDLNCTITEGVAEGQCVAEMGQSSASSDFISVSIAPDPGSEYVECSVTGAPKAVSSCAENPESNPAGVAFLGVGEEATMTITLEPEPVTLHALNLSTSGTGTGSLQCDTGSGPEACEAEYAEGTVVTVIATADEGSEFVAFSGDCTGSTCELTMNGPKSVDAQFDDIPDHSLSVTKSGSGPGTVECDIDGGGAGPCPTLVEEGSNVEVITTPGAGSDPAVLSGTGSAAGCSGSTCSFEMTEPSTVDAEFNLETVSLSVTQEGEGSVECEVNAGPLGPCPESATYNDVIKVVAKAAPESTLVKLTGTGSAEGECTVETEVEGTCEFTITESSTVNAKFVAGDEEDFAEGNVHGEVPQTTTLDGAGCEDVDLGEFIPGEGKSYDETCVAILTSTGAETTFTASDPSAESTGHLVHSSGNDALDSPLEVKAEDAQGLGTGPLTPQPLSPVTMLTFIDPIANDTTTLTFNQPIGAEEGLLTGEYAKTILLTLAQTP